MAETAGKAGSITFAGITVGVKSFVVNHEIDLLDISDFGDSGVKKYLAGLTDWSATVVANYDDTNTADVGDEASLTCTPTSGETWSGNAILRSMQHNQEVAGVATVNYDFQGSGALTPPS